MLQRIAPALAVALLLCSAAYAKFERANSRLADTATVSLEATAAARDTDRAATDVASEVVIADDDCRESCVTR